MPIDMPSLLLGVRKLFQPDTFSMRDPGMSDTQHGVLNPSIGQAPDSGSPTGGLDDNVAQITKLLLDRLNQPDPNVQRMTDLFNQFPAHQNPSIWRRLAAGGAAIGGGQQAAESVLNAPDKHAQGDWILKSKQAKDITDADTKNQREEFGNAIKSLNTGVANQGERDKAAAAIQKLQQDLDKTNGQLALAHEQLKSNENDKAAGRDIQRLSLESLNKQREIDNLRKDLEQERRGRYTDAQINHLGVENTHLNAENDKLKNPPGSAGGKPLTPYEQGRDFNNKLQKMQLEHPDWAQFVKKDANTGQYGVKGADPVTTSQINKYLGVGTQKDINLPSGAGKQNTETPNKPPANSSAPQPTRTGKK
jgi:hypothetical protein